MDTFNILHLSDLHIGEENKMLDNLVDNLGEALNLQKIHVVIFTGDIFHKPPVKGREKDGQIDEKKREELIEIAVCFFKKLLEYLKEWNPDLSEKNFWFVAGNHDLYRQKDNNTWSLYDGFLEKFYNGSKPKEYNDKHMILKIDSDHKKVLIGFNSNIDDKYDKGESNHFVGHITKDQLRTVREYLKANNKECENYDKIAFFHHPCNMFEEQEHSNIDGIMNNSLDVSKELAKWNVKLVLYGHKHWAKPSIYRPLAGQKIYMFAGGAIGRLRDKCSGNIIEIDSIGIHLKEIVSEDSEEFEVKTTNIPDNYMEGLLLKQIEKLWRNPNCDEIYILELINKLYLSYEQLNILQHSQSNLCLFENSIKYKLGIKVREDLFENINKVKWNEVKAILDDSEIPSNVRDRLQIDLMERRCVAFALLGGFFTDLSIAIKGMNSVIRSEIYTEYNLGTSSYYIYFNLRRSEDGDIVRQRLDDIMDEFQGRLYELQDFLYCIKLNIKNIFLELRNDCGQRRHCDFDASVSRLIQLLTGTNIYCHEYSFVRELIQNSIDAVSFWEKQNPDKKLDEKLAAPISVEFGCDKEGEKCFKIRDYGIGMKQEIIERYFATLGRSYYKEYTERRNINYNSVSNFGIGFLSVFKPCRKIIINTSHYLEKKFYKLEINSNCGHYTLLSNSETEFPAGTEVVCYFRDPNVDEKAIITYIRKIMLDIKYDIDVYNSAGKKQSIKARKIRHDYDNVVFIPFDEETKSVKMLKDKDRQNWKNALSDAMTTYRHGILVSIGQKGNVGVDILSAGILLQNAKLQDVFKTSTEELRHMKVTLNFPPNWLDIDVSREKVNGICTDYIEDIEDFKKQICNEFKNQIWEIFKENIKENKNMPLIFFKEASILMKTFECGDKQSEEQNVWDLKVCFEEQKIRFYLNHKHEEITSDNLFHKWVLNIIPEHYDNVMYKRNHETIKLMYKSLSYDEVSAIYHMLQEQKKFTESREVFKKLGLDVEEIDDQYLPLVSAIFLEETQFQGKTNEVKEMHQFIEAAVWENCKVEDVVKKSNKLFSVGYDNRERNRIFMDSDKLKERVDILMQHYNIHFVCHSDTYQYDFVWTYIIWNAFAECGLSFKDNKDIQIEQQKRYESLRDAVKILHIKGTEEILLDIYTIASCYMSILMDIPKEILKFQKGTDEMTKYQWIFDVGLGLLYMWMMSDGENSENKMSGKERRDMLFNLYKQKRLDSLLSGKIKDRYIQLLASQEKKTFDVLCFAELLRWLDDYIQNKIFRLILS